MGGWGVGEAQHWQMICTSGLLKQNLNNGEKKTKRSKVWGKKPQKKPQFSQRLLLPCSKNNNKYKSELGVNLPMGLSNRISFKYGCIEGGDASSIDFSEMLSLLAPLCWTTSVDSKGWTWQHLPTKWMIESTSWGSKHVWQNRRIVAKSRSRFRRSRSSFFIWIHNTCITSMFVVHLMYMSLFWYSKTRCCSGIQTWAFCAEYVAVFECRWLFVSLVWGECWYVF